MTKSDLNNQILFSNLLNKILILIFILITLLAISYICYSLYLCSDYYIDKMRKDSIYGTAKELPLVKKPGNARIAVFMVATSEIEKYSEYTIEQNKRWAESHGYDFYSYDKKILKDLPINFSKIQYALNLLQTDRYDYVMYIDADAIIHSMDYDIRHLIKTYMTGLKSIMFGEDCFSSKDCSKPGRINSGVFVVKNNYMGNGILRLWRDSSRGDCSKYVNIFPNCQLVFTNCVFPKLFMGISIIPFNLMNGFGDTLFIKHAMAMDDINRVSEIKKLYNSMDDRIRVF